MDGPQQCAIVIVAAGGTGTLNTTVTVAAQPQPGAPVVVFPSRPSGTGCTATEDLSLSGRWTLIAWVGADGMSTSDALAGGGCGTDIASEIAVIWGFDAATQTYQAYFPASANVPGANNLDSLTQGLGYWVALANPSAAVTWTVDTLAPAAS